MARTFRVRGGRCLVGPHGKHGTPTVLKSGQTLHLRCWTLVQRGKMTALERNRNARAGSHDRQLRATGEADSLAD